MGFREGLQVIGPGFLLNPRSAAFTSIQEGQMQTDFSIAAELNPVEIDAGMLRIFVLCGSETDNQER